MKKTGLIILGVIGAIALFLIISVMGTYNSLVSKQENVNLAQSQVETMLQRRADLIPNLVATVKGYTKHEEQVFSDIANARAALNTSIKSGDIEGMDAANKELDSTLSRLLVVVENYPTLSADKQYISLMDQLEGSENRIAIARENYNEEATKYNKSIRSFPTNIFAGMFGFEKAKVFQADEGAQQVPTVNFD